MIPKSLDTLRIDINSGKVRKAVSVCKQDTVQRTLNFLLVNSGNSVDLSNVLFAEILIHKADGAEADNGCVIDGDSIQYTLRTTDVSALGTNQAQLLLTFADGQTLTTPTFEINVYSKVLDQNVQKSQNEYGALTAQLVLVNEMSNQIGAARDTAIAKATEAEASADAAAESATSANAAKDDVAASASAAATSAGEAAASATLAVNAAGEADTYADNAADSAFDAAQSKDNAASSATAAAASASSASTSAYTATQKAAEIVDSANAAAASASAAALSEDNALDFAERAEEAYRKMGEDYLVLGETSTTAYRGDRGKIAYEHSQTTGNPHNTTAAQVGADVAGAAAQAYQQAAGYTDTQIANLINGAPSTLDTLKEIADTMAEHEDVVEALNQAIGTKASDVEFQAHQNNTTVHVTANERTAWDAKQNATDNSLNTTDKTIVGAINENTSDISQLNQSIGSINNDLINKANKSDLTTKVNGNQIVANISVTSGAEVGKYIREHTSLELLQKGYVFNLIPSQTPAWWSGILFCDSSTWTTGATCWGFYMNRDNNIFYKYKCVYGGADSVTPFYSGPQYMWNFNAYIGGGYYVQTEIVNNNNIPIPSSIVTANSFQLLNNDYIAMSGTSVNLTFTLKKACKYRANGSSSYVEVNAGTIINWVNAYTNNVGGCFIFY